LNLIQSILKILYNNKSARSVVSQSFQINIHSFERFRTCFGNGYNELCTYWQRAIILGNYPTNHRFYRRLNVNASGTFCGVAMEPVILNITKSSLAYFLYFYIANLAIFFSIEAEIDHFSSRYIQLSNVN